MERRHDAGRAIVLGSALYATLANYLRHRERQLPAAAEIREPVRDARGSRRSVSRSGSRSAAQRRDVRLPRPGRRCGPRPRPRSRATGLPDGDGVGRPRAPGGATSGELEPRGRPGAVPLRAGAVAVRDPLRRPGRPGPLARAADCSTRCCSSCSAAAWRCSGRAFAGSVLRAPGARARSATRSPAACAPPPARVRRRRAATSCARRSPSSGAQRRPPPNATREQPVARGRRCPRDIGDETEHLTTLVDDLLLLARTDSGAIELDDGRRSTSATSPPRRASSMADAAAAERMSACSSTRCPAPTDRRPAAAPATGDDPRRQRDRALPAGRRSPFRVGRHAGGRPADGRRRGTRGSAPMTCRTVRPLLARRGRAGRRNGPRPRDRALGDRAPWRHDLGLQSPGGWRPLRRPPPARPVSARRGGTLAGCSARPPTRPADRLSISAASGVARGATRRAASSSQHACREPTRCPTSTARPDCSA